jgi:hypothetical protein
MFPGASKVCPGMGGADSYSVTLLDQGGPDGSLGRCSASAVGSPLVHNEKIINPAKALVEIRGRASCTLATSLPQSANDEFSARSKVRVAESSDGQFGTSKFKELQFSGPSLEGGYAETAATESYEVATANDISTVVRSRTGIGEQGARCDRGERAGNSLVDVAGDLSTFEDFDENERSQATAVTRQFRRWRRSSVCWQALSHPTHLARPRFVSGADKFSVARSLELECLPRTSSEQVWRRREIAW